ncbi:GvpL/GvpF family gas vesicle protein [Trebonia kvetii]|uniref:GvpL/GvpF family gas vesicle protein n=1 Tax=Trebonia kvetii TaxID=2480626 RepID=A0A6P2BP24_9ACTN|nr:GvpL/GvpF family gas vesicle protein [Trebonia kvetii]TVZ00742.1 GvpL/GvpF family gas vesicle protein [Trebonia kvetii]
MSIANIVHPEACGSAELPGRERQEQTTVWAYAIIDNGVDDLAADLTWMTGVGGAPVRVAACSGLSMLVSDVSETQFGEAALRRNLENLDWLDEVARAHHHVIDAAARLFPLLPTRLATVYSSDAAACAALDERRAMLRGALRRVDGRVEWGVKAYAVPESETAAPRHARDGFAAGRDAASPDEDGAQATRGGTGLAYLRRRRAQLAAGRESRVAAVDAARTLHGALAGQADGARLHPPQSPQLSGVRLPMLLNAAYLVPADGAADFNAAVAARAAAHPELRIEVTGPWPPYSFVGDDDDGC